MDDDRCQKHHDREVSLGLGLSLGFTPKRDRSGKNKHVLFLDHENAQGCNNKNNDIKEDDHDTNCSNYSLCRKKLRLTTDQTTLLEDSFRKNTTLNTPQKMALAEKLNLKPRQVEVWFQNRRARTKLKQTEKDCEMLRKTCERLRDENWRLKKELLEVRSSSAAAASQGPLRFLEIEVGTDRGGGEKKEAAAGVEVVHGIGVAKPNHEEQQKLAFVGEGKLKGE